MTQKVQGKNFEKALGARFRHHKADLVARFIKRTKAPKEGNPNANKEPWEVYQGHITKEQWQTFAAYAGSPEFKKKSLIGEKCAKGNIHRHPLGQKSYNRKRSDWEKEKRLPPPPAESSSTESSVMSRKVQNRALEWCLAHQRRTRDGKWEVDPSKVETANVVSQVMEYMEKESKEKEDGRAYSSEIDNDALSKALGKMDYYGFVKGVGRCGVGVGYRKAFGKVHRKGSNSRDEDIAELKATIARLESMFEAHIASFSSINMAGNKEVNSKPPQQQPTVEVPKKCRLAVMDNNGNLVVVADGTCHPSEAGVLYSSRLLPNHYIVSIDNPYVEHNTVELPVASPDGETELSKAKGYFVAWPMSMVLFDDTGNEKRTTSQSKKGVGSCDPLRALESERTPSVPGGDTKTGELNLLECDLLQMVMVEDNHQSVRVTFKVPFLYLKEDQEVWVTSTDVDEVVRGACINVSVIHVYIRYLVEEVTSAVHVEYVTFICPHRISAEERKRNFLDVVGYVKHAFNSELKKKHSMSRVILVPYN